MIITFTFFLSLIDGWNANYVKIGLAQLKIPLATDFRKYLIGFYKFYGFDFDYKSYIICVLTGTRVPKVNYYFTLFYYIKL